MSHPHPPKWALRFLRWYCREDFLDEIEGDLRELFEKQSLTHHRVAGWMFTWNVLRTFRLVNLKKIPGTPINGAISFRQSVRYLRREKIYTLLNTLSLVIGLTLSLIFALYAYDELTFDQFHTKADRIQRVSFSQYLNLGAYASTSYPIGLTIAKDFPEVEQMTRFGSGGRMTVRYEQQAFLEQIHMADDAFFQVFDFELIQGNPQTVLSSPNQIVISKAMASKYFGTENPIGKMLNIGSNGNYDAEVTGVFANPPINSQLQFDMLLSYRTMDKHYPWMSTLWQQMPRNYAYVLLKEGVSAESLEQKLPLLKETYVAELKEGDYQLMLTPLKEVHFMQGLENELATNNNKRALMTFGLVVLLVMIVSLFNFITISSSRLMNRFKEMGVRKVLGANKQQLILQLMFQSFLIVSFSLAIAWSLAILTLPQIGELTGKSFQVADLFAPHVVLAAVLLLLFISIIAGLFPTFGIVAIPTLVSLKIKGLVHTRQNSLGKSAMLIFQYGITMILLVSSIVIYNQLDFIQASVSDRQQTTLVIPINTNLSEKYELVEKELLKYPFVQQVAASSHVPSYYGDSWPVRLSPESSALQTENFMITENFPEVLSYELISGRQLNADLETDVRQGFVVNETCAAMLGFASPEAALEQTIYFGGGDLKEGKIIGVCKDFHFESFKDKIRPALFQLSSYDWMTYNFLTVNLAGTNLTDQLSTIEQELTAVDPGWVMDASFFDEHFKQFHIKEITQARLASSLSLVAVLLSCLGQLGLILNFLLSRKKEFAIRKVLGATVRQLWMLTTRNYLTYFIIAFAISVPIAAYALHEWLNGFYYHISPGPGPYLLAGLLTGATLLLLISVVTINTARANPTESLSDE